MPSRVARLETRTRATIAAPAGAMRSPFQRTNSRGGLPRYSSRRASSRPSTDRAAAGLAGRSAKSCGAAGGGAAGRSLDTARFTLWSQAFTVSLPYFSCVLIYHGGPWGFLREPDRGLGGEHHPVAVDEPLDVRLEPEALGRRGGTASVGKPRAGIAECLDYRVRECLAISRGHQTSVESVRHHLGQATHRECDDRTSCCQRLDGCEPQAFG